MPGTSAARLSVAPGLKFNGLHVFSATVADARGALGEHITEWLASRPRCTPTEFVVLQSSDSRFHCVTIIVFFCETRD